MHEISVLGLGAAASKKRFWEVVQKAWNQDINEGKLVLYLRISSNIHSFHGYKTSHHLERSKANSINQRLGQLKDDFEFLSTQNLQ